MKPKLELAEHNCCTPPEQSDTESGRAVLGERRPYFAKGCGKIKWTKSVSWVSIFQLVQIIISLALCYSLITAITRNGNEKITFCHIC